MVALKANWMAAQMVDWSVGNWDLKSADSMVARKVEQMVAE